MLLSKRKLELRSFCPSFLQLTSVTCKKRSQIILIIMLVVSYKRYPCPCQELLYIPDIENIKKGGLVKMVCMHSQGSTLTVARLPGASENDTQLVRSGKWKWFCDMFNSWTAKWLILNYSLLEVATNFT
jgi:hypothetical protein